MNHHVSQSNAMSLQGDETEKWKDFKAAWANYIIATFLDSKMKKDNGQDDPDGQKVVSATLCAIMGQECFKMLQSLHITAAADKAKPAPILNVLRNHFVPREMYYSRDTSFF